MVDDFTHIPNMAIDQRLGPYPLIERYLYLLQQLHGSKYRGQGRTQFVGEHR
ncbi:hypothetical protein YK56LOC_68920 [Caballeronia sp. HLA56]